MNDSRHDDRMGTYKEIDPWELAQKPGYHEEEYYCRATDGHGHSESMPLKFSPGVQGQLAALVASGKIPNYRTPQDVVRDAVIHRLHYLSQMLKNDDIERTVDLNVMLSKVDYRRKMRQEQEALITQFREECDQAIEANDLISLGELLELGTDACEGMRSGYLVEMQALLMKFGRRYARMRESADAKFTQEHQEQ